MLAWPREKPIRSLPTPNSTEVMAAPIHTSGQARQTSGEDPVDHGDQDVMASAGSPFDALASQVTISSRARKGADAPVGGASRPTALVSRYRAQHVRSSVPGNAREGCGKRHDDE